jgi:hypothetical protein
MGKRQAIDVLNRRDHVRHAMFSRRMGRLKMVLVRECPSSKDGGVGLLVWPLDFKSDSGEIGKSLKG